MNRKARTKDKTTNLDLLEHLDDQPVRTLEELQRNSLWFQCSQEEIDDIKAGFFEKPLRARVFKEKKESLNPEKIVKQFIDFYPEIKEDDPTTTLCHNFEIGTSDWKKLFQWSKRESVIDLLDPVHYQIYGQHELQNKPPKSLNSIFFLQNALIYSHISQTTFRSVDIVKQIELLLNCTVTHLYLTLELLVCLFEWQDDDVFGLTVCFSVQGGGGGGNSPPSMKGVTVMERSDLFDDSVAVIENSVVDDGDDEKKKKSKNALIMDKLRTFVRECSLSYIYYGFVMRSS